MTIKHNILITVSLLLVMTGFASGALWGSALVLAGTVGTILGYKSAAKGDGIKSITEFLIDPSQVINFYLRK